MEKFKKTIRSIVENYENLEDSIVSQLMLEVPSHHPTTGSNREEVWKSLFEQIIPKKFAIDQGIFIIDSYGSISREVDLVIYDESYTPYIFNYGKIKFIPIEAVAAVIQCKSTNISGDNKKILEEWVKSIDDLKTSTNSVVRVQTGIIENNLEKDKKTSISKGFFNEWQKYSNNLENCFNVVNTLFSEIIKFIPEKEKITMEVKKLKNSFEEIKGNIREISDEENKKRMSKKLSQTATRPIKILCYTNGNFSNSYSKKESEETKKEGLFDFLINIKKDKKLRKIKCGDTFMGEWNNRLNHAQLTLREDFAKLEKNELKLSDLTVSKKGESITIMSLIFQLNQLLMIINNPMFFPHKAYVDMFNEIINEEEK